MPDEMWKAEANALVHGATRASRQEGGEGDSAQRMHTWRSEDRGHLGGQGSRSERTGNTAPPVPTAKRGGGGRETCIVPRGRRGSGGEDGKAMEDFANGFSHLGVEAVRPIDTLKYSA